MEKLRILPKVNGQAPATSMKLHQKSMEGPNYVCSAEVSTVERPVEIFTAEYPTERYAHPSPIELSFGTFRSGL